MNTWMSLPTAQQALAAGQYGTLIRLARTAAGLTLDEAGQLSGYSAATLSRIERGRQPLSDVHVLRHLSTVFAIPPAAFGLTGPAASPAPPPKKPVESKPAHESSAILDCLWEVMVDPPPTTDQQVTVAALRSGIAAARAEYRSCKYRQLARRLPWLLRAAMNTTDRGDLLAEAYNITTLLLIKLQENGLAWTTTDRARQAAAADPTVTAETARLSAIVLRRSGHYQRAQQLATRTAEGLAATTQDNPAHAAAYGRLLATAAYTAALADDRDAAWELLARAESAAGTDLFGPAEITLYKIGIARALGDYGTAIEYARKLDPREFQTAERRARYWQDTALALYARGRLADCRHALEAAERTAPQEVRLPWARTLTRSMARRRPAVFHAEAA